MAEMGGSGGNIRKNQPKHEFRTAQNALVIAIKVGRFHTHTPPQAPTRHPRGSGDPDPRLHNPQLPAIPAQPPVIPAKAGTQKPFSPAIRLLPDTSGFQPPIRSRGLSRESGCECGSGKDGVIAGNGCRSRSQDPKARLHFIAVPTSCRPHSRDGPATNEACRRWLPIARRPSAAFRGLPGNRIPDELYSPSVVVSTHMGRAPTS